MSLNMKKALAAGAVATAALGLALAASVTPASAATTSTALPAGLTLWSGAFTGQTVNYPSVPTTCTNLPFPAQSEFNGTSQGVLVYKGADCTGNALFFPASDIHSFTDSGGMSIKAA